MKATRWLRLAQGGFIVVGILSLGYCVAVWVNMKAFQAEAARQFDDEVRAHGLSLAPPAVSPVAALPVDGGLVGRLEIPRLGVSVMVVEGINGGDLKRAAGHIPGTALPGQCGNVGIAGHRDTFFRPLHSVQRNDTVILRTLQGSYRYRVVSTRVVAPEDVQVLYPTGKDTLTLVTCFPFDYVGSAPNRFIVQADLGG